MKYWINKIEWYDIIAPNNSSRFTHLSAPKNITFGIIFKTFKYDEIPYVRILRNIYITDEADQTDTDDFIDIPKKCISKITKLTQVEIPNCEKKIKADIRKVL